MKKIIVAGTLLALAAAGMALADTLYLRDGNAVQGRFIGFEDGQFIFETSGGQQAQYPSRRVSRLVLDRAASSDAGDTRLRRAERRDRDDQPQRDASRAVQWVAAAPVEVRLEDKWIQSGVQVRKGQRVRIEASGSVTLDGRYVVSPDGRQNARATDVPLAGQNDGALIAVIGQDEDAPLFLVGRQREFAADRNGMLYFTLNHWETRNTGGAFRVVVSVEQASGVRSGDWFGTTPRQEKILDVAGTRAWTDTGIDLTSDGTLEITCEGRVSIRGNSFTDPEGNREAMAAGTAYPLQTAGAGAVIARTRYGNGTVSSPRFVGSRNATRIRSDDYGRLFLGINDNYVGDNGGSYRCTVRW